MSKPDKEDIYYPHRIEIVDGIKRDVKWSIAYYNKPTINRNDKMGCYFIYDTNKKLVYVGKSNYNLYDRACASAIQRTNGNFSKIELYPMETHANTNIYEIYFIAKYNPMYNSESCYPDNPTFELPVLQPKYVISREGTTTFDVEQITPNIKYITADKYWSSPESYFISDENFNYDEFYKFHSTNKRGVITQNIFENVLQNLQNKGYLTFSYNNKKDCFRKLC